MDQRRSHCSHQTKWSTIIRASQRSRPTFASGAVIASTCACRCSKTARLRSKRACVVVSRSSRWCVVVLQLSVASWSFGWGGGGQAKRALAWTWRDLHGFYGVWHGHVLFASNLHWCCRCWRRLLFVNSCWLLGDVSMLQYCRSKTLLRSVGGGSANHGESIIIIVVVVISVTLSTIRARVCSCCSWRCQQRRRSFAAFSANKTRGGTWSPAQSTTATTTSATLPVHTTCPSRATTRFPPTLALNRRLSPNTTIWI